jgi:hypothetical protein
MRVHESKINTEIEIFKSHDAKSSKDTSGSCFLKHFFQPFRYA